MQILLIVLVTLWLSYKLFSWTLIFAGLVYLLWYTDEAARYGTRAWEQFRRLSVWQRLSPVEYVQAPKTETDAVPKYMFLVMNETRTKWPLIWTFGLHSGRFGDKIRISFFLPAFWFKLPVVRELLLWMGGVAYPGGGDQDRVNNAIMDLIQRGHSVVCEIGLVNRDALCDFLQVKKVGVLLVVLKGEEAQYRFSRFQPKNVQQYFARRHCDGYMFPLLCCPTRKSCIQAYFSDSIAVSKVTQLKTTVAGVYEDMSRLTFT